MNSGFEMSQVAGSGTYVVEVLLPSQLPSSRPSVVERLSAVTLPKASVVNDSEVSVSSLELSPGAGGPVVTGTSRTCVSRPFNFGNGRAEADNPTSHVFCT